MISRIRFFRLAPVMPAAQGSGDSIDEAQTARIPSAYSSAGLPVSRTLSSQWRSRSSISFAPISHTTG
jgi:hypothetical protein